MSGWYHWDGDDLTLRLRIQPKASRDTFVGPHSDDFKIRITAPPVDGKANAHLIKLLAKAFGVPRSQVTLVSGKTSRSKCLRIHAPQKAPIPVNRHPT
ncbi:MAG: hypothetical protein OI74_03060 [Gammaproteobacteria bacterium (ex Lamellibrachia satsuma)]|nr:MAG: YggU family protein [Gammaproteobacteria bacterium (ex Lamellibrachia satsuma)]RRS34420.1 MAG: hypothetical protein NV67_13020 [Gammaproteobacteria bacterium (ex Lamellibrachia satsuma)]RRS35082.1 MAG: hypothetical protein OI74_03060 [Gammaproteobacteria bacterium (ex Lamellibrachia satsuma)]